jgi:hypothetical protein
MSWFKYIFHRHKWRYFGHFLSQYIFTCAICHRDKKINIINENDVYNPEKIDIIRKQMINSVSHLHK